MTLDQNPTTAHTGCPVCQGYDIQVFFELYRVPTQCNVHYHSQAEARQVTRGDIQLAFCRTCGHIFNPRFRPELMDYDETYENSLHHSPRFQRYAESLVDDLIERHSLHHKVIIDVGCGKGEFLHLMCERGKNRGIGFDPSYVSSEYHDSTLFVQDYYSEKYSLFHADLVSCRHVLEHIYMPREFLDGIRRSLSGHKPAVVFVEVPNVLYTVRDLGIWDIIYEHYSYFTMNSLVALFQTCGFHVEKTAEAFGGQFLTIEAARGNGNTLSRRDTLPELSELERLIDAFGRSYTHKLGAWRDALARLASQGKRLAVWGCGSKGVTFLNALRTSGDESSVSGRDSTASDRTRHRRRASVGVIRSR
jgi:SAM-dependent methyltransferase